MMWRIACAVSAVLVAAALVPAVRHLREVPSPPEPPLRLELTAPPGVEIGGGVDQPLDAAVSPSGRELVFVGTRDGESALWRRRMDAARAEPLAGTEGAAMPAFSADGSRVWFFSGGMLRRLDLAGGEVRDMAPAPAAGGVSVRADDDVLFAPGPAGPIVRLARGQRIDATRLRDGERAHLFPAWAGTRDAFVYLAVHDDGRRIIRLHDGDDDVELRRADSHGIVAAGRLLHVRETTLVAEPLDLEARRLGAPSVTLAANVGIAPDGRGAFAASDRLLVSGPPAARPRVIRWVDVESGEPRETLAEPGDYWQVRLSPDARTVAVTVRDPLMRTLDVFTVSARGGPLLRVTLALASDTDPVWSPDSRRIAFRSLQNGAPQIFAGQVREPIFSSPLDEAPSDWTRNGLVFHARGDATGFDVFRVRTGAPAPEPLARSAFNERDARVSPDGRLLAYASDESGRFDIYVTRLGTRERTRVSTAGAQRPRWTGGAGRLVFLRNDDLMRASVGGVPERLLTLPGVRDYDISADGRRVLAILPGAAAAPGPIAVLSNWRYLIN